MIAELDVGAVIVLLIILGSAVLSFVQEYNANNAAEKLRARLTLKASVLRDCQPPPFGRSPIG